MNDNYVLFSAHSGGLMMDAIQWNACHLPLKDGIVDVFVSDLVGCFVPCFSELPP